MRATGFFLTNRNRQNRIELVIENFKKHRILLAILAITLVAFVWHSCATGKRHRYFTAKQLEHRAQIAELTPLEIKRFEQVVNQEISPCGDNVTLAESLFNPDRCPLAPLAGSFVVKMVAEDYNPEEISEAYVARYAAVKGLEIPIEDSPTKGPSDGLIELVVFTDFECPYCARASRELHEIFRRYPDKIRLVHKNYPIKSHQAAELAARAGFAAHRQGKFWEMHDALFSAIGSPLDEQRIEAMAIGLGLDVEQFREDIASTAATAALTADRKLAKKLGVTGTPTILVNGRTVDEGISGVKDRLIEEFLRYNLPLRTK